MSTIGELIGPKKMVKPKKNFLHENVRKLREVQVTNRQTSESSQNLKRSTQNISKFRMSQPLLISRKDGSTNILSNSARVTLKPSQIETGESSFRGAKTTEKKRDKNTAKKGGRENADPDSENCSRLIIRQLTTPSTISNKTPKGFRNQGTQTVDPKDFESLYHEGVIRYPSTCFKQGNEDIPSKKMVREMGLQTELCAKVCRNNDRGDSVLEESDDEYSYIDNKGSIDYVKLNSMVVPKPKTTQSPKRDPIRAPPSYQKGVLPKYLRELKKEHTKAKEEREEEEVDPHCPPGHTPLPNEVRLEHLNILKQNYADLVTQLNKLPVRSDTLKTRLRKKEMETELEKIEAAMAIFSRARVFIKPNPQQA